MTFKPDRRRARRTRTARALAAAIGLWLAPLAAPAQTSDDPYASNIGVYPPNGFAYNFRRLSHDYPAAPPAHSWLDVKPKGRITIGNAADYMTKLKAYVEPSLRKMIEAPQQWQPAENGWYDQPWEGFIHPSSSPFVNLEDGRDPILGSFTGQIILKASESGGLSVDTQNHTVVYYDPMAASTLGDIWKDVHRPNLAAASYREGSLVVKAGAVAATPQQWPVVDGAPIWQVYRPPVDEVIAHRADGSTAPYTMAVQDLRLMQFDIIVKDTDAAPETGWVFTTFIYDRDAPKGTGPWDQIIPLGASWGNDPQFDDTYGGGPPPGQTFLQFWANPSAPAYSNTTLGWGGRMSGPIDIAERHAVITVEDVTPSEVAGKTDAFCDDPSIKHKDISGPFHASGCFSCHGTSQSTYAGPRMYPSPFPFNAGLPSDGQPFCLYTPGRKDWALWFQNRPGSEPMPLPPSLRAQAVLASDIDALPYVRFAAPRTAANASGTEAALRRLLDEKPRGLDYDMLLMFAVGDCQLATEGVTLLPKRIAAH